MMIRNLFKKRGKGGTAGKRRGPKGAKRSKEAKSAQLIEGYLEGGRVPWSQGYREYKWQVISSTLADPAVCRDFASEPLPDRYGKGLDERVVEYPWMFPLLLEGTGPILDGGSVLNFEPIVKHPLVDPARLTIAGLAIEKQCFYPEGASYQLCDLRDLPFRDDWFEVTLCISTLEHIGMNNEIYGHEDETGARSGTAEGGYLEAVKELVRVTRPDGTIAITVPVGKYEDHGFFHQFDRAMIDSLVSAMGNFGPVSERYFRYRPEGWTAATWSECEDSYSHNPQTGTGAGEDGAAHCRAVGCFLAKGKGR